MAPPASKGSPETILAEWDLQGQEHNPKNKELGDKLHRLKVRPLIDRTENFEAFLDESDEKAAAPKPISFYEAIEDYPEGQCF